jgi:hypothetical protein
MPPVHQGGEAVAVGVEVVEERGGREERQVQRVEEEEEEVVLRRPTPSQRVVREGRSC